MGLELDVAPANHTSGVHLGSVYMQAALVAVIVGLAVVLVKAGNQLTVLVDTEDG